MFCRPFQPGLSAWLLLACQLSVAAPAEKNAFGFEQRYHVTPWTAAEGIPHNHINALAQTPDGYIWIGTWFGLARFDGLHFTVYDQANTPAFVAQEINALTVDNEGAVWIGTADGLLRFRDRQFTRFSKADGLPARAVYRLIASRDGGVWLYSPPYLAHWRDQGPTYKVKVVSPPSEDVRSMKEEADGSVIIATSHALRRITPNRELQTVMIPTGAPKLTWGGIQRVADSLWISAIKGLWVCRDGSWTQALSGFCRADTGTFMGEDRNGFLWVNRKEAGFWRCRGDALEPFKLGDRGAEKSVGCMLESAEGHLWFGTGQGLFQLRPTLIRAITAEDGLPSNRVRSVCEAPDGAIWLETEGGVGFIRGNEICAFGSELFRDPGSSIQADHEGRIWFGSGHNGLINWRRGVETNWFWGTGPHISVAALYSDRDRRLWVGTGERGVTWFEDNEQAAKWGEFGLPTNGVRSIYQSRDGTMWFGTWGHGVVRWKLSDAGAANPPSVSRLTAVNGLADDRVLVFHEDDDGVIWIGTHNGVSRLKDGRLFTFRAEHGLVENFTNWMEEDDFGHFWFSCNRGIYRIARRELNAVADGKMARAKAALFGIADGMLTVETEGEHQPAGCKSRDGRIWFPTTQGVVVIDPRVIEARQHAEVPPPVVIEQVTADGEVIYGNDLQHDSSERRDLKLPPGRARLLKIRFTANSFSDPHRVRFQYRLSNHDEGWREPTDERLAYYTNLRPGRYRFEVKAASPRGVWNETPGTFEFSLSPHFWQTWPFYVMCGVMVVGLASGVLALRLQVQRRILRLEHQRAMEQERARLARDLHDDLGTALTGLALEMDVARRGVDEASAMSGRLQVMADNSRAMAARMREVVWAISPRCDDVPGLATFLEQHAAPFVHAAGLRCRLEFPEILPALPVAAETRHQLALGVREALTNVVRHARASEVVLSFRVEDRAMILRVTDNGIGFDSMSLNGGGHGLANLRSRLGPLGGSVKWESTPGGGTVVTFYLPLLAQRESNP